MQERGVIATRQLAKRQLTWLRSEKDLTIYDSSRYSEKHIQENALKTVEKYLDR
jgi:tRNA dimethylallyltransferase